MILPIVAYGAQVLQRKSQSISADYPNLEELIENMFETMEGAQGVGLAAPQVGLPIRLFVVDAAPFSDDEELSEEERERLGGLRKVFINAQIIEESGEEWAFREGCLSIPEIREDVSRKENIVIQYLDENFTEHTESYSGVAARIIQHEYDHIEGVLFTDKLSSFKKRLLKNKLNKITQGKIDTYYPMRFPTIRTKKRI